MAGLSRSVWTLLQQLTSTDLQAGFRLQSRDTLEALRWLGGNRAVVLGGLEVTATATGIAVAPGALLQPFPGGASSAPRTDESGSVFARSDAIAALEIAVPGADTWSTIAARMTERDTRATRLVLDETSGSFDPVAVVVQREAVLEFLLVAGTTSAVNLPPAGYVPLAAVLRRAAGGAVVQSDIYDLRPLLGAVEPVTGHERFEVQDYSVEVLGPEITVGTIATVRLDVEVIDRNGLRLTVHASVPLPSILAPGFAPGDSTWLYLYLSPWRGLPIATPTGRGILVLTGVPPSVQGGRANAAAIPALAPHAYTIAAGEATCIGALRTSSYGGATLAVQHCVRGVLALPRSDVEEAPRVWDATFLPKNARRANFAFKPPSTGFSTPTISFPSAIEFPLLEAVHVSSQQADTGGVTPFVLPSFGLVGVDIADINATGGTGGEYTLRSVEF